MRRIPSLDGLRAISIIMVLIAHCQYSLGFPFHNLDLIFYAFGVFGVTIFFVISGFLITFLLLIEEDKNKVIDIKFFYFRRVLRIFPVYILYCILVLSFKFFENYPISNINLLHLFTYTSNFDHHVNSYFQHFWSLSVEEQFYLFWPFILILFRKNLKLVVIIFLILSCVSRIVNYKFPNAGVYSLFDFFEFSDSIFIGALGGILFFEKKMTKENKVISSIIFQSFLVFIIFFLIYFAEIGKFGKLVLPFGNTIISFSILLLIFNHIKPSARLGYKLLNSKIMVHIGKLSYSLYIWQQFFLFGKTGIIRTLPFNIIVIYGVALASYYLWELPFLKLKTKWNNV